MGIRVDHFLQQGGWIMQRLYVTSIVRRMKIFFCTVHCCSSSIINMIVVVAVVVVVVEVEVVIVHTTVVKLRRTPRPRCDLC